MKIFMFQYVSLFNTFKPSLEVIMMLQSICIRYITNKLHILTNENTSPNEYYVYGDFKNIIVQWVIFL